MRLQITPDKFQTNDVFHRQNRLQVVRSIRPSLGAPELTLVTTRDNVTFPMSNHYKVEVWR